MPTPASPPATADHTDIIARAINAQFRSRPTFRSQTWQLFKSGLEEKYPQLDVDPYRTLIAQPIPDGAWRLTALLDVVLDYLASGTPPDLSEQFGRSCFLTNRAPAQLTVDKTTSRLPDMQVIAGVIRELPGILYIAFQESLTAYWNDASDDGASRWQWLGDVLAGVLKTSATQWSSNASETEILLELANHPDPQARRQKPWSKGVIHACTLQTTLIQGEVSVSLQTPDILVICGETHLLCSVTGGIEAFPSLQAFGSAWGARFQQDFKIDTVTWKRFEPDGNIFDIQAALLLSQQLEDLASFKLPASQPVEGLERQFDSITDVAALFIGSPFKVMALQPIQSAMPDWLQEASAAQRMAYRKHVLTMASISQQTNGRSFRDGIDDLHTFAKNALHKQMLEDQPLAPGYNPDELELTFHVAVGDLGSGYIEPVKMSLTELAIKNLSGKPKGRMTIRHTKEQLIQDWTDELYLLGLVSRVNVGKHYPEQVATLLLGDSPQARERERLFGQELAVRLPIQALEHAIKGEHGFTHRGYRYVDALMNLTAAERVVNEQAIVIRPLAFQRKVDADADVVSNMFIIEPKDLNADGPHILYRPLYTPALHEYPSRTELLKAIAQSSPLQTSVLTWISDRARPIYANNGFNEPHITHFHAGDEFSRPEKPKPAILVGDKAASDWLAAVEEGRLLPDLFASNARALVGLADKQSVSDAESRWAIILEGSWLVFNNLVLPVLRGPAMLVGWMVQITHSLINDLPALDSDDATARNGAWVDILLNIGLILLHVARDSAAIDAPLANREGKAVPVALDPLRRTRVQSPVTAETAITQETPGLPTEPPGSGETLLDFDLSAARDSASARLLNKLLYARVPWPKSLPEPIATGAFKGLYRINDQWHATLAGLLFRVSIEPGFGEVYVVHPEHPDHPGVKLKANGNGQWMLDQGLKLVGGGPKKRIAAERERRQQRIALLGLELQTFFEQQERVQKRVDIAENLMQLKNQPASTEQERAPFRHRFVQELDKQSEGYRTLLAETKELSDLTGTPPNQQLLCNLLENLINNGRKRVVLADLDRDAINQEYAEFSSGARHIFQTLTVEGRAVVDRYFDFMRKTSEINETMITNLDEKDSRLLELKQIARLGADAWKRLTGNRPENELGALRVKSYQLAVLRVLTIRELGTDTTDALEHTLAPLLLLSRSHAELQTSHIYESSDRIAVLDNLVDHYNKALDGLESIGIFNSDKLQMPDYNRLREIIDQLRADAERRLAEELERLPQPEETSGTNQPPVSRPAPSNSRKKVIKTTKGTLIGDIRQRIANQGGDIVDINGPLEDKPLTSFHEHEPNVWVEIVEAKLPAPKPSARAYPHLKGDARKAMADVDRQVQKIEGYAQRASSAKEIEEQLQREAQKLSGYADKLERHEDAPSNSQTDASLVSGLRDKARVLNDKATELRTRMTLTQPPTSEGIEYLLPLDEIYPRMISDRVQLTTGRRDFMQEYVLFNRDDKPLWYAHFHYEKFDDAKANHTEAHLKTVEQRFETYASLLTKAKNARQKIDIHHGSISDELANNVLLPLKPFKPR